MSKIKKVKIKQNDGGFLEVPIGAEANNVTYEDITLQQALNNIQLSKENSNIILTKPNGTQNIVSDDNTTYPIVSQTNDGIMSANDKIKLDSIESGATARGKFTLLWQNPNGSAEVEFGYQTAALNQSIYNFDALVVYFWVRSVNGQRYGFEQVLHQPTVNQTYKIASNWEDINNKVIWDLSRYMKITTNTSIYFYPCYIMNYNGQSYQENNWCNYPVAIYGIVY